jgi:AGCS family alanine or glycine:cation symporter
METFSEVLSNASAFLWGAPLLVLLVGTGLYLTIRLRLIQVFKLGTGLRFAFGSKGRGHGREGDIAPFQALMTALAATIGTGNIVGVAGAIAIGGPGALFWMWVIAVLGMATKYGEALLAVKYRIKDARGKMQGGPMYYIERGLGTKWKWLAMAFAIFGSVAAFGIGNMVQANSVAANVVGLAGLDPGSPEATSIVRTTGIILAILTGAVILGGIKSIGRVASVLVPVMAVCYLVGCLAVVILFAGKLPGALVMIITDAFTGTAATGGFIGATIGLAISKGVARGVFSNESGLGSAPIAAAAAQTDEPAEQGLISMMGTFIDSIVICTMTGFAIIVTGVWTEGAGAAGAMTQSAFSAALPGSSGGIIVGIGVIAFAYSTLIGWSYYGERCIEYLLGVKAIVPYRILWVVAVFFGAVGGLKLVWSLAESLNALMAIPNLIALILLSGVIVAETRKYWDKQQKEQSGKS